MKRLVLFIVIVGSIWTAEMWWLSGAMPQVSTSLAMRQLSPDDRAAADLREFESLKYLAVYVAALLTLVGGWLVFRPAITPSWSKLSSIVQRRFGLLALGSVLLLTGGCMKPYDTPEFVEIDTSETGFLIPLEGDTTLQARFQSEDYLKQRKVAAKRIQITHRWLQQGRMEDNGRWIPMVRLVKVNRSPVTREWVTHQVPSSSAETTRGSANDQAIWIESSDSVGFSMGFTCTAFIAEEDAARFLYWYPSGSLADVMDKEVRGRVQQAAAEVAAKYPLDALRAKKQEIVDAVKVDLGKFFTQRGVTVTTVGMFGGMTYENPEIQKAIDGTFVAQQLKVLAEAKLEAQRRENERIMLEADATAEKSRREAKGLADARKTAAAGEAEAIREVNRALNEAQQNPLLYRLKALEVEKARVERWDGEYPQYYLGMGMGSENPSLLLNLPAPAEKP